MSNRDSNGNLASDESETGRADADLRGILDLITGQIADADRRHSEMLEEMHQRLSGLGTNTSALKSRVPAEFEPAFARIEDGIGQLADRIATASVSRDADGALTGSEAAATSPSHGTSAAAAPMPLKSALTSEQSSGLARKAEAARATSSIDPFDVIETSVPGDSTEPWDEVSANALAHHYESGNAGFQPVSASAGASATTARAKSAMASQSTGSFENAAADTGKSGLDRVWLDARFAEIAMRIDQSLAELHPEQSFMALGQRFDDFENRFGDVIAEVASRSDVEAIRTIEIQINELAAQFEQAQALFDRLDTIESQINALGEHMLAGGADFAAQPAAQAMLDPEQIAAAAADRVAQHMQFMPQYSGATDTSEIGEVRRLVEGLIQEQRIGDDNTATMLDTLQQAMMRLLDRVDAMELAQHQTAQKIAPVYAKPFEPMNNEFQGGITEPGAERSFSGSWSPSFSPGAEQQEPDRAPAYEHQEYASDFDGNYASEPVADEHQVATSRRPEKLRQDFIADARRARERQASQATAAAFPAISDGDEPVRIVRGATPAEKLNVTPRKPEIAVTPEPDAANAGNSKRLLIVAGLVGVLALVPAYMLLKSGRRPGASPVVATSPLKPAQPVADKTTATPAAGSQSPLKPQSPVAAPAGPAAPKSENGSVSDTTSKSTDPTAKVPAAAEGGAKAAPETPKDQLGMPSEPGNLYTTPETVIDDLKFEGEKPSRRSPGDKNANAPNLSPTVHPAGMNVQNFGHGSSPEKIAALTEQNASAALSRQIGVAATNFKPAALLPSDLPVAPEATRAPIVSGTATNALDLPPATVGPLSLRLAAAKGDPSAEFEVGARLAEGKGTQQNFKEAVRWYQRSATQGFAQAQYRLGTLYERGLGVKEDLSRARVWYGRAAEQGNVKAMHNLAVLSAGSASGAPDYATAAQWFLEAAERGLADSQYNLAVLHENGLGVPQDLKIAYKWLAIAARSGDKETVRRRDAVKAKLDATDLAAAQDMTNGWKQKQPDAMANDSRTAGEAWKARQSGDISG